MLLAVLSVCSEEELSDADSTEGVEIPAELPPTPEEIQRRRQEIKNKILAVGKVQRMFQMLRSVFFYYLLLSVIY
jgi:serine/threonine-protein phosphatase 2B catalytic subunit